MDKARDESSRSSISATKVQSVIPKNRYINDEYLRITLDKINKRVVLFEFRCRSKVLKWNGWGYNDSKFEVTKNGMIRFTSQR